MNNQPKFPLRGTGGTTIIIADDHHVLRDGMATWFPTDQYSIVASVANGRELVEAACTHLPQLVVTDILMPEMNGIEATRLIKKDHPQIKIIGMSAYDEYWMMEDMIDAGAEGFMMKNVGRDEMHKGFSTVLAGGQFYCTKTSAKLIERLKYERARAKESVYLTGREKQIMQMIVADKSSAEIAAELCITVRTIEKFRHNLFRKLKANTIAGIAVWAVKNGHG